jgi:putative phage-type endonuclease
MNDQKFPGRRSYLGASEVAAAVGVNPWRNPLDVYLEKTGQAEPADLSDNDAVLFGTLLEDVVAQEFARRQGVKVQRQAAEVVHPRYPWLKGHIDRRIVGQRAGLECKTAGVRMAKEFGEEGTDFVPAHYLVQCAAYLAITGWDEWHLAVLIGGQEFRMYRVPRDEDLIATLEEQAAAFWARVVTQSPPDPNSLAAAKLRWPRDYGASIQATPEIAESVARLLEHRAAIKYAQEQADQEEFGIKTFMGDNAILLGPDGKPLATWKNNKPSKKFDAKRFQLDEPEIYETYLVEVPGPRVFLPKKVKA